MSKVFSISMATVLMLMSLMGSMQPTNVTADESQEVNPVAQETPADDQSDTQDVLVEEPEYVEQAPAEEEELPTESENLTPAEEPAENANSPPADDDPVVEDQKPVVEDEAPVTDEEPIVDGQEPAVEEEAPATDGEPIVEDQPAVQESQVEKSDDTIEDADDMIISPNAVDPEPGDCPVGELCDGGGGGDEVSETVIVTITITQSGQLSSGATVVVRDSGNAEVGSGVTGANGIVEIELTVGGSYLVDVSKTGYQTRTGVSLPVSRETSSFSITLLPVFGKVTVTVTDSVTGERVRYAIVRFTGKSGTNFNVNTNSGSTGQISPSMNSGEYVAFFSHPDYVSQSFDATIIVGDSIQVKLVPEAEEPAPDTISVHVVDKDTGDPIPNATVTIRNPIGWAIIQEGSLDANGRWESTSLTEIPVRLEVTSPYHFQHVSHVSEIPSGVVLIEMDLFGEASLTLRVTDVDSGVPIEDALITMVDEHTGVQVGSGRSDAMGNWVSGNLPGAMYTVTIQADGYQTETSSTLIRSDHTWNIRMMPPGYAGSLYVWVVDDLLSGPIVGATITMRSENETLTFTTDEDDSPIVLKLAPGTYDVTIEANGYTALAVEHEILSGRESDLHAYLDPLPSANLTVQLQEPAGNSALIMTNVGAASSAGMSGPTVHQVSGAVQPIAGQTIKVVNPDTGLVMVDGVTDADGIVTLPVARQGIYQLSVTVEGYQPYSAPYELTQDSTHVITLQPIVVDNPDDGSNPDTGTPDDDSNPDTGTPEDRTTPGTGIPDDGTTPDPGTPDDGTTPDTGNTDDGSTPATGGGNSGEASGSDDDNDVEASDGPDSNDGAVAQSGGTSTDATSRSVDALPNTGAGGSQSHIGIAALTLVAAFTLLGALGVRRRV